MAACDLPTEGAVIKVTGHAKDSSPESKGNQAADAAAREAAKLTEKCVSVMALSPQEEEHSRDIFELYAEDDAEEKEQWVKLGAQKSSDGLWKFNERYVCPSSARTELMSLYHGLAHAGPEKLHAMISKTWWWPKMRTACIDFCKRCLVCLRVNSSSKLKIPLGHAPRPQGPWTHLQIDFIGPLPPSGGYTYILMIVDLFSIWVEAFPLKNCTADATAKVLFFQDGVCQCKLILIRAHTSQGRS